MTGDRARVFVALELPQNVQSKLAAWRAGVLDTAPSLRPVPADGLHVTLCFLGTVEIEAIALIGEACAEAIERNRVGGVPLSLAAPLWLPPRGPRVLAVAVDDLTGGLAGVQSELAAALAFGGWYEADSRPFRAHVTVARVRGSERLRPLELDPPEAAQFIGSTVAVYRSRPGSQYEPLRRLPL